MRRSAKPATAAYLERVAIAYLERHPGSTARLRAVLERRVRRSVEELGTEASEGAAAIEAVIGKLRRLGYLDDVRFASSRVRTLRARGKSARAVRAELARQGIETSAVDRALEEHGDGAEAELEAARALVRRRRLGWLRGADVRDEHREKDLARLARAGFSYSIATRALEGEEGFES